MEPDKVDGEWTWVDLNNLPSPLFTSLETMRKIGLVQALSAKTDSPRAFFKNEYKDWTLLSDSRVRYLSREDVRGNPVAIYFADSKDLKQPTMIEGTLKEVTSQRVQHFDETELHYTYQIETKSGRIYPVAREDVIELRVKLPQATTKDEFQALYKDLPALNQYELRWHLKDAPAGHRVAILTKVLDRQIVVVGTLESARSETSQSFDDTITDIRLVIRTDEGIVGHYFASSVIEMRVFGKNGVKVIK